MFNEDGSVAIIFNGCIYNHLELRPELEALGHRFASRCDTEVIVHAWEAWGPACLERLAGMFAFAIWDRNRDCLFLARDRLGKKPLHYATLPDGRFAFASELGGMTALPALPRRIDPAAVDDFFAYGFIPEPATIWQDVRRLPAAHSPADRAGPLIPRPRRYWRIPLAEQPIAEAEAVRALDAHLVRAVRARLIADVPLGAFLSGGVDSSAVVAVAAGLSDAAARHLHDRLLRRRRAAAGRAGRATLPHRASRRGGDRRLHRRRARPGRDLWRAVRRSLLGTDAACLRAGAAGCDGGAVRRRRRRDLRRLPPLPLAPHRRGRPPRPCPPPPAGGCWRRSRGPIRSSTARRAGCGRSTRSPRSAWIRRRATTAPSASCTTTSAGRCSRRRCGRRSTATTRPTRWRR